MFRFFLPLTLFHFLSYSLFLPLSLFLSHLFVSLPFLSTWMFTKRGEEKVNWLLINNEHQSMEEEERKEREERNDGQSFIPRMSQVNGDLTHFFFLSFLLLPPLSRFLSSLSPSKCIFSHLNSLSVWIHSFIPFPLSLLTLEWFEITEQHVQLFGQHIGQDVFHILWMYQCVNVMVENRAGNGVIMERSRCNSKWMAIIIIPRKMVMIGKVEKRQRVIFFSLFLSFFAVSENLCIRFNLLSATSYVGNEVLKDWENNVIECVSNENCFGNSNDSLHHFCFYSWSVLELYQFSQS